MVKWLYIFTAVCAAFAAVDFVLSKGTGGNSERLPAEEGAADVVSPETVMPILPRLEAGSAAQPVPKPRVKQAQAEDPPTSQITAPRNVCPAIRKGDPSTLTHFGQPVRLNGANIAWSRNAAYARDVGTDYVDIAAFKNHFANIAKAGGNSARWWMHTNGSVTPHIGPDGRVRGLSAQTSNSEVISQVRHILDAAWAEGILLNITLFSFDMMCDNGREGAHSAMMNTHYQSYIDNALTPLVRGLKDHPALFAWEIFNEAEGMALGTSFFGDPSFQNCATGRAQQTQVLQRFVNHTAARIHAIDPNVKVTTSVGHPRYLEDYTNSALLGQSFSQPSGGLDFYQIHWYAEERNPFTKTSKSYGASKPIVVGEYKYDAQTPAPQNSKSIFENGYAGAWTWSQTSEMRANIFKSINSGVVCAPPVNKAAIMACLNSKSPACYKGR